MASSLSTFNLLKGVRIPGSEPLTDAQLRVLQFRLLQVLEDVTYCCHRISIPFILCGGSALGAYRHGGFIPWDDDLDIAMRRQDLRRFETAFLDLYKGKYCIYKPGNPSHYSLSFPRIRVMNTMFVTREDLYLNLSCQGVFVDVFPIESTGDSAPVRISHGVLSLLVGFAYSCCKLYHERKLLSQVRFAAAVRLILAFKYCIGAVLSFRNLGFWTCLWDRVNGMFCNSTSTYISIPTAPRHFFGELYRRDEFEMPRELSFSGIKVRCFGNVEDYLRRQYGPDYMTPQPPDRRERHLFFGEFKV